MSAGNLARWISLIGAVACGTSTGKTAPKGWIPEPAETQASAYGGWIELTYRDPNETRRLHGELVAVTADSVWVLDGNGGQVISTAKVKSGTLTVHKSRGGALGAWTALGTVSTLSNGVALIFTAPMWLIGGPLATSAEYRAAARKNPPLSWVELAPFARFPQGMPEGISLRALHPKVTRDQPD